MKAYCPVCKGTGQIETASPLDALDQGRRMYRTWMETLLVCEASDAWPAYAQGIVPLSVPDNDVELDFGDEAAA